MGKIKILIADDHAIVREGLKLLFSDQKDLEVIGEAEDGKQALEKVKVIRPDVILLDIAMPQLNGLEVISLIKKSELKTQIVVLSMHSKGTYVQQVLAAGALGYVLKASPSSDILEAIRAAYRNEYFLSSKLRTEVICAYAKRQGNSHVQGSYDLLSEREQQVFRLTAQGNSNGQIGEILFISPKTVEKHRNSIMNKLGIHGRIGLMKYAIKIGVVDPDLWED
jgi:DNA-binding NarL/FixJ family response regulator